MQDRAPTTRTAAATQPAAATAAAVDGEAKTSPADHNAHQPDARTAPATNPDHNGTGGLEPGSWAQTLHLLEADDLRLLLTTMPIIEQAKGVLMNRYRIGAERAFDLLRLLSQNSHTKIRDLARTIVDDASHPSAASTLLGNQTDQALRELST